MQIIKLHAEHKSKTSNFSHEFWEVLEIWHFWLELAVQLDISNSPAIDVEPSVTCYATFSHANVLKNRKEKERF